MIHHGGFGTTASTLRSGAPGIIVPHIIDQFYWGQRVAELGAGPRPIPRGKLGVDVLRQAITQATQDAGMRQRAGPAWANRSAPSRTGSSALYRKLKWITRVYSGV